jgi:cell division transport system permease protein
MAAENVKTRTSFLEVSFLGQLKTFNFLPQKEKSNRFLPLIIAVMAYLTLLGSATGLAIFNATDAWSTDLSQILTVQIVHPEARERERQSRAVIDVLENTAGVIEAHAIPANELEALLEPWFGVGNVTDDLPVPAMVSVTIQQGVQVDTAALNARLQTSAPDASLDDHQQWIGQLASLSNMVQVTVFVSIALIVLTTIAMVVFATKSALTAHRETVEIVHLIGAKDSFISSEFRKLFMLHGFKGGLIGLIAAILTIALILYLAARIGGGLLPQLDLTAGQMTLLGLVPLLTSLLSMWTADVTVRHALGKMV